MDTLKITIDREKNQISVQNNGRGIPVEKHKKEGIMIPELIFGHLQVCFRTLLTPASPRAITTMIRKSLPVEGTAMEPN